MQLVIYAHLINPHFERQTADIGGSDGEHRAVPVKSRDRIHNKSWDDYKDDDQYPIPKCQWNLE